MLIKCYGKEQKQMTKLLNEGKHIWINAPALFGHELLIEKALTSCRKKRGLLVSGRAELAFVTNTESLISKVCNAACVQIMEILESSVSVMESAKTAFYIEKLTDIFHALSPRFSFDGARISISFDVAKNAELLGTVLKHLDDIAQEYSVSVVFNLNEFQVLSRVEHAEEIESTICHFARQATCVILIFSSSEQKNAADLMLDECESVRLPAGVISLKPLTVKRLHKCLDTVWREKWLQPFPRPLNDEILRLTLGHPHYLNQLLELLFEQQHPPGALDVTRHWQAIIHAEKEWYKSFVLKLKLNELKMLSALAEQPDEQISSQSFTLRSGIAGGSIQRTCEQLLSKDLIGHYHGQYRLINPVLATLLRTG